MKIIQECQVGLTSAYQSMEHHINKQEKLYNHFSRHGERISQNTTLIHDKNIKQSRKNRDLL